MKLNGFASPLALARKIFPMLHLPYPSARRSPNSKLARLAAALLMASASALSTNVHASVFFNSLPVPNAGGPYSIHLGDSLIVNGSATTDPDINLGVGDGISQYVWDLGANGLFDGFGVTDTFTAAELASAGFTVPGQYALLLRVTDNFGASAFDTTTFEILAPITTTSVPEPESLSLVLLSLSLLGASACRRCNDAFNHDACTRQR